MSMKRGIKQGIVTLVLAAVGGGIAFGIARDDPEAGSTTEERTARHQQIVDDFKQNYADWLRSDHVKNLDLSKVPRKRGSGEYGDPKHQTFAKAVDAAVTVVKGTVLDIEFIPHGTLPTFKVDRTRQGCA